MFFFLNGLKRCVTSDFYVTITNCFSSFTRGSVSGKVEINEVAVRHSASVTFLSHTILVLSPFYASCSTISIRDGRKKSLFSLKVGICPAPFMTVWILMSIDLVRYHKYHKRILWISKGNHFNTLANKQQMFKLSSAVAVLFIFKLFSTVLIEAVRHKYRSKKRGNYFLKQNVAGEEKNPPKHNKMLTRTSTLNAQHANW